MKVYSHGHKVRFYRSSVKHEDGRNCVCEIELNTDEGPRFCFSFGKNKKEAEHRAWSMVVCGLTSEESRYLIELKSWPIMWDLKAW